MPKVRSHNEWFRVVSLGNRKSCPTCHDKLTDGESVWSWGEYHNARWYTVKHFCSQCFVAEVLSLLEQHVKPCHCTIVLQCRESNRPEWLVKEVQP